MTKITNTGVPQVLNPEGSGAAAVPAAAEQPQAATPAATGITAIEGDKAGLAAVLSSNLLAQSGINPEIADTAKAFVDSLSTQQRALLSSVSNAVTATVGEAAPSAPEASSSLSGPLQDRWSEFVTDIKTRGGPVDVNALVQWVLRESYMETTQDLYFYAEKVKFYNNVKKEIRNELQRARDVLVDYAGKDGKTKLDETFKPQAPATEFTGSTQALGTEPHDNCETKADLEAYIETMEEKLSSVGDDAQLANVDLQNMLQKQQQTMQMMSNIAKMLHDTAMAIIRKIGS